MAACDNAKEKLSTQMLLINNSRSPYGFVRHRTGRIVAVLTGLLALVFLLSGCDNASAPDGVTAAREKGFPRQVATALGTAVIERPPVRIVTLGAGSEDIVLALGQVPIGIESHRWGGDEQGYLPWFRQALEQQGQTLPTILHMYPELDIEQLINLKPDVIIATQSGISQSLYDQLSRFAPVVAYPGLPWLTSTRQQIELIGHTLGKEAQAQDLLQQLESTLADAGKTVPGIARLRFAYIKAAANNANLSVYVAGDPRVDTLSATGLQLAPSIKNLTASRGSFASNLGLENADRLNDVDILVTWYNSEQERQRVEQQPLFNAIAAVRHGGYIPMTDQAIVMAMSYGTPLSVDWGLQRFMPLIAKKARHLAAVSETPP